MQHPNSQFCRIGNPGAPRTCAGKTRRFYEGVRKPCSQPAVRGSRFCRFHGGGRKLGKNRKKKLTPRLIRQHMVTAAYNRMMEQGVPQEIARLDFWANLNVPQRAEVFLAWEALTHDDRRPWKEVLKRYGTR